MKKASIIPWVLFMTIAILTLVDLVTSLAFRPSERTPIGVINTVFGSLLPISFAFIAALILSRQTGNVIGWLLFMPALSGILPTAAYIQTFTIVPTQPPILLLLAMWFSGWSWLLLIFPIYFIPVLFPSGRPPSSSWRWLIIAGIGMCVLFIFVATFTSIYSASDYGMDWIIANPIGFIPGEAFGNNFMVPWAIALLSLTVLSVVSLFVRYQSAPLVEREQIKWLLYACGLFAAFYLASWLVMVAYLMIAQSEAWDILFSISILTIPASIAIAIRRYRLWDVDIIIRRTMIYGILTALP